MLFDRQKVSTVPVYLLQAALALIFIRVGIGQITNQLDVSSVFDNFDNGSSLRLLAGVVEIIGAFFLLLPGVSAFAAAGLAVLMLLAAVLGMGNYSDSIWLWTGALPGNIPVLPNILLVACLVLIWLRRDQFSRMSRG